MLVLLLAVCEFGWANGQGADVVSALNGEWDPLTIISGFHRITEPNNVFQTRVIEANGKATIAFNPITLFVVVTNDASAGDLQQHIWRLPVTVTRVRSVAGIKSGVRIAAVLDAKPNANGKGKELKILVRYNFENGVLKDTITVQRE